VPVPPLPAPTPAYPRRLDGAQIEAHYRAHAFLRANQASKPLDLEVRPDGSLRRDCPRCQRVRAAGSLVLKPESAEVCFYWRRVSYPESGCFQLHQEGPDRFAVRDPGGRAILEYALPP